MNIGQCDIEIKWLLCHLRTLKLHSSLQLVLTVHIACSCYGRHVCVMCMERNNDPRKLDQTDSVISCQLNQLSQNRVQ